MLVRMLVVVLALVFALPVKADETPESTEESSNTKESTNAAPSVAKEELERLRKLKSLYEGWLEGGVDKPGKLPNVAIESELTRITGLIDAWEKQVGQPEVREALEAEAKKNPALKEPEYSTDNFYLAFSFMYAGAPLFSDDSVPKGDSTWKRLKQSSSPFAAFRLTANFRYKRIFEAVNTDAYIPTSKLMGDGGSERYPDVWTGGWLLGDSIEVEANWSITGPTNGDRIGGALGQNGASLEVVWDGLGGWHAYASKDAATGLMLPEFGISYGFSTYFNLAVDTNQNSQVTMVTGAGVGVNLIAGRIIETSYENDGKKYQVNRGAEMSFGVWGVYFQAPNVQRRTVDGVNDFWVRLRGSGGVEQINSIGLLGSVIVRFPFSRVGYAFLKASFLWSPVADVPDGWYISSGISISIEEVFGLISGLFTGKGD